MRDKQRFTRGLICRYTQRLRASQEGIKWMKTNGHVKVQLNPCSSTHQYCKNLHNIAHMVYISIIVAYSASVTFLFTKVRITAAPIHNAQPPQKKLRKPLIFICLFQVRLSKGLMRSFSIRLHRVRAPYKSLYFLKIEK